MGAALLGGQASAATIQFTATDDGTVKTFGGDSVDTTSDTISVVQSGVNIVNGVLEFDLGAIGPGATVNAASLSLALARPVSNAIGATAEVDIFAYGGDGAVTIADFGAAGTQVFDGSIPTGGSQLDIFNFNLTQLLPLQAQLGGLLTLRLETDSFASLAFLSMEQGFGAAFSPILTIDFTPAPTNPVPIPGALPLFAAGLASLGFARSKQRKPKA
ncbi:hypothetical protein GCM10007148_13330 [Parvularcula lutaonensis]|nr:hypothetical protein GCM10007148_13330 [Parvularcula lutaonensis]